MSGGRDRGTALLSVQRLAAGYGWHAGASSDRGGGGDVLQDVHLTCAAGEIVAIVGPNGAGKSTLLKAMFGQARVRAGSITFAGHDLVGVKPAVIVAYGLSYVPQLANVFPSLTVEENLQMGALAERFRRRDRRRRDAAGDNGNRAGSAAGDAGIGAIYELFPILAERRRQPAGQLSGGQRQMVALGRALMLQPRMLLLDEPSAGLAPDFVDLIFGKIADIGRGGVSIVLVEQNVRKALLLADRAYVLASGRNVMEGPAQDLIGDSRVARLYLGAAPGEGAAPDEAAAPGAEPQEQRRDG